MQSSLVSGDSLGKLSITTLLSVQQSQAILRSLVKSGVGLAAPEEHPTVFQGVNNFFHTLKITASDLWQQQK
jgi:hypothetical protein